MHPHNESKEHKNAVKGGTEPRPYEQTQKLLQFGCLLYARLCHAFLVVVFFTTRSYASAMHPVVLRMSVCLSVCTLYSLAAKRLLPPPRSTVITSRLTSSQTFPKVYARTKRYCSFIQYGLNHHQ